MQSDHDLSHSTLNGQMTDDGIAGEGTARTIGVEFEKRVSIGNLRCGWSLFS